MHSNHLLGGRKKVKDDGQECEQNPPFENTLRLARTAPQLHSNGYSEKRIEEIDQMMNKSQRSMSDPNIHTCCNQEGCECCESTIHHRQSIRSQGWRRTAVPPHQHLGYVTQSMGSYQQLRSIPHRENGQDNGYWCSPDAKSQYGHLEGAQIISRNNIQDVEKDSVSPRTSTYSTRPSQAHNRDDGSNSHAFAFPANMQYQEHNQDQKLYYRNARGYSSQLEQNSVSRYPSSVHSAPGTRYFSDRVDSFSSLQDNGNEQETRRSEDESVDSRSTDRRDSGFSTEETASSSESTFSQAPPPQPQRHQDLEPPTINLRKSYQNFEKQRELDDADAFECKVDVWPDELHREGCPDEMRVMMLFDSGCRGSNWVAEKIVRRLGGERCRLDQPARFYGFNGEPMLAHFTTFLYFRNSAGGATWWADFLVSTVEGLPFDMVLGARDCLQFGILKRATLLALAPRLQTEEDQRRQSEGAAQHAKVREENASYTRQVKEEKKREELEERKRRERERRRRDEETRKRGDE